MRWTCKSTAKLAEELHRQGHAVSDRTVAKLLHDAGLPEGVLNLVHGGKEAVDALLQHPLVRAVSFVGSTPVAKYIYTTSAAHGKRVQALGGAKTHAVILPHVAAYNASAAPAAYPIELPAAAPRAPWPGISRTAAPTVTSIEPTATARLHHGSALRTER